MLDKIKNDIINSLGNKVKITYNGSRNKIEVYDGFIIEVYDSLFIVKLNNGLKKSFSYIDILTGVTEVKC